jgi:thiol-disulfide isomerase/thioredoxin
MESSSSRTKLLKFSASWCGPCRYMSPIVEGVLGDTVYDDVELISVDIDEEEGQEFARMFNVRSIPTLILLDDTDKVVNTLIGAADENELREFLSTR